MAHSPDTPSMGRASGDPLTDSEYWDSIYRGAPEVPDGDVPKGTSPAQRGWRRRIVSAAAAIFRSRDWFWGELVSRFVEREGAATVLEIGAAPGDEVLTFRQRFGHEPFGLEYSPAGAAATRQNFARQGVSADNVILGDLFDASVTKHYQARFDVVFSRGFIEHFRDPSEAIRQHVCLAKEAGLVVITIPTLSGIHFLVTRLMMPHQIAIHNLSVMRRDAFARLFQGKGLEPLYCDYGGGLNLLIAYDLHPAGFRRLAQAALLKLQLLANLCGRMGLCRGRYLNGSLVFIGRKRTAEPPAA